MRLIDKQGIRDIQGDRQNSSGYGRQRPSLHFSFFLLSLHSLLFKKEGKNRKNFDQQHLSEQRRKEEK